MALKNLYDQLKREYRIELEKNVAEYQYTYGAVKSDLMSCNYANELQYNTFSELNTMNIKRPRVTSFFDMIDY